MISLQNRTFEAGLGIGIIASQCLLTSCGRTAEKKQDPVPRTNIIYIMADDLGYHDLGCFGQEKIRTPNIDKMAAEGLTFTRHYAGTSVCAPSRCVLMTGLHTGHCYVRGNMEADPYGQLALSDEEVTVAELLKKAGYVTGQFGKWGLGVQHTEGDPRNQGFDEFFGYHGQVHAHNSFPEYLYHNRDTVWLDNEVVYMPEDHWTRGLGSYATEKVDYSNDLIQEAAMKFIKENKDTLFFAYLPFTIPHNNGEAPEGYKMESPGLGIYEDKDWDREDKAYAAMITRLDRYVSELMDYLKQTGLDKNTLVIFTSDNGGQHTGFFDSNAPLRGMKRDLYEGGIRVPTIAWWPGTITPGTSTEHVSAFWDFLPTACEIAGVDIPDHTDGISYLPVLKGEEQGKHDYLYWEFHEQGGKQAIRVNRWKAVRLNVGEDPDAPLELYDLVEDIDESDNIASAHPELVRKMDSLMEVSRTTSEHFNFGWDQ